jgi:hypothetical protein
MTYTALLTTLGLAKIADALANDTSVNITTGKIGDGNGNPVTPNASWTDLVREVYSDTLTHIDVDPGDSSRVFAELVVPADEGGWTIREVGLYDTEGDLIAVAAFPAVYKPTAAEGATLDLIIRLVLDVSNASAITLQVDTSIIVASRSWVEANFSLAALIPGGTTSQILAKASNADGDTEWVDAAELGNVVVNIVQEVQTLSGSQTVVNLSTVTADDIGVYLNGVRLLPTAYSKTGATQITLVTPATAGDKLHVVQNDPAGAFDYLQTANNLSDVPNKATARANLELLTSTTYLDALWALMQQRTYPVGEIITTRRTGNPSTWLGFGTWERYGQGRVLVGYDEGDASFNALDKTGGAKTHVLTVAEMPTHNHDLLYGVGVSSPSIDRGSSGSATATDSTVIANAGGGQAHNNLQPYITVFMWKRTA